MTVKLHLGTEQVFSAFSKGAASCIKGKYLKVTSPYSLKTELIVVSISAAWKWVVILTIKNSLHDNAGESRCGPITVQAIDTLKCTASYFILSFDALSDTLF